MAEVGAMREDGMRQLSLMMDSKEACRCSKPRPYFVENAGKAAITLGQLVCDTSMRNTHTLVDLATC